MDGNEPLNRARGWWGGLPKRRRIMLGAVTLAFASQFLPYGDTKRYILTHATDTRRYTGLASYDELADGWTLHPQALPILLLLAAAFGTSLAEEPAWRRWSYWAGALLVFLAIVPAAPVRAIGGALGLAALGLAVWAAVAARKTPA